MSYSRRTYEVVTTHICTLPYELVTMHMWASHDAHKHSPITRLPYTQVTHINFNDETRSHTYEWVMERVWLLHNAQINESRRTFEFSQRSFFIHVGRAHQFQGRGDRADRREFCWGGLQRPCHLAGDSCFPPLFFVSLLIFPGEVSSFFDNIHGSRCLSPIDYARVDKCKHTHPYTHMHACMHRFCMSIHTCIRCMDTCICFSIHLHAILKYTHTYVTHMCMHIYICTHVYAYTWFRFPWISS